jgi:hypothetical protein
MGYILVSTSIYCRYRNGAGKLGVLLLEKKIHKIRSEFSVIYEIGYISHQPKLNLSDRYFFQYKHRPLILYLLEIFAVISEVNHKYRWAT